MQLGNGNLLFLISLKAQHVSSGTSLIIRSSTVFTASGLHTHVVTAR